jgi:hypothetical protein
MKSHTFARCRALSMILARSCFSAEFLTADQFGLFTYWEIPGGILIIDYPTTESGSVEIPAEINGLLVTSIGDSAFSSCIALTSVTIPSSVTSIGSSAFRSSIALTSVTIPSRVTGINPPFPALRSGPTAVSGAARQKQIPWRQPKP